MTYKPLNIFIILATGCTILSGCVTKPTPEQIANANYGTAMKQEDCEAAIKNVMQSYLKDPQSAQYQFGTCHKSWVGGAFKSALNFGYDMDASINAKNSFGGYTGAKQYKFFLKNGSIISKSKQMDGDYSAIMLPF